MGPLHNKQALLFIHFMCVRRPFSTRQLPPATYRFPLKGQYEVLNPSYSEKKLARMKPQNRFNASAPGQPVRTIAFENFLVFNNEAEFGMILNKRQFDVRKSQWICFLISGKRPKNVGIMLEKVANYLYLSS